MFLKSLEINGFKSFADKTRIDFNGGITSLLGPNGCGKSNIVDAIKWVLGEQSTKSIRASRMDDVIFAGTETRKPRDMAEVTLWIDNEERHLQTDLAEVMIRRRIYRGGENEYYMNGQRCLLKNIRELFMDTGVGKSAYSILEQGKIDQILSNRPEDRRYIFEEAAGISRYKAKCIEARNRIAKSDENIAQLTQVVNEVKRTYDRTKVQAAKAQKWQELKDRAFYLDVDIKLSRVDMFLKLKDKRISDGENARIRRDALKEQLYSFEDAISSSSNEVSEWEDKAKELEIAIGKADTAIESISETIAAYEDSYRQYLEKLSSSEARCNAIRNEIGRLREEKEKAEENLLSSEERLEEKESQLSYTERALASARLDIASGNTRIREAEESNAALDRELQALSEELKEVIGTLIEEVDEKTGTEYSALRRDSADEKFLTSLASARKILTDSASFLLSLPEGAPCSRDGILRDFSRFEEALSVLSKAYDDYKASIPPVIDTILSPGGLVSKKRAIGEKEKDARESVIRNHGAIEAARLMIESREKDSESLLYAISSLRENIGSLRSNVENQKENVRRLENAALQKEIELDDEIASSEVARRRVHEVDARIKDKDDEKRRKSEEAATLRSSLETVRRELKDKFSSLDGQRREKDRIISSISAAENEITANRMYVEQIENSVGEIFASFFETYARNLAEFEDRMRDDMPQEADMKKEWEAVSQEIKALGNINHAAKDEFDQAEDQYKFYSRQLEDYARAKEDMESVLGEILEKSQTMFLSSYKEISDNFQAMFTRLFGGGRARLSLSDETDVLNSGIEIFAQPPGKSMSLLSSLSGGERSMTAVALLFATYQVKPSPFCILDEIDAALDDRNIGYFLDVLQEFARDSQFIIITHNTHTVTGGDSMLGVSQMEAGVSSVVSYRIASIEGQPRILNDEGESVEFDDEGRTV